jgi:protein-disulfide isomerase
MKNSMVRLALCLGLAAACSAQSTHPSNPGQPLATVGGQPIYEQDLQPTLGAKLLQLRSQEYQAKNAALQDLIRQKLLEAEAQKRGVSVDKLQEQEVDSKVSAPSDGEVEGYYLAVRNQTTQPFEEVKPQLQTVVKTLKIQQARQAYADALRAKADIVVLLAPPKVEVAYDAARVRGNPKAPVTIVEFSDYQCPYCKKVEGTLNDLLTKYNGQIKLAYRDFPMRTLHPQAQLAAEASRCAEEQGKFWEYHDALLTDQSKLDEAGLTATAQRLGLHEKSFQSCLVSGKFKAQVEQDVQDGTKAGVSGTPGFFINGVSVNGSQPQVEFEKIIDLELAGIGGKSPARASR